MSLVILHRNSRARCVSSRRIWVEISSIATMLLDPGTIYSRRHDALLGRARGTRTDATDNIGVLGAGANEVVERWLDISQVPCNWLQRRIPVNDGRKTNWSRTPSTLRPRSSTSRLIRRASMMSESHCTKIWNRTGSTDTNTLTGPGLP